MTLQSIGAAALLGAACLACVPASHAQSAPMRHAAGHHDAGTAADGGTGAAGAPGPRGWHGLALSEAQRDRQFAILHQAAPQRREYAKARRKALEALRAAGVADSFDEARAAAAAQALGQAIAAEELLRARTEAQLAALLTPEQREALHERRQRHDRAARAGGQ